MNNLKNHVRLARQLRRAQTPAEKVFWDKVRRKNINGIKFLRQHPLWLSVDGQRRYFIADFYCPQSKLVIEIDGPIHCLQEDYDSYRTQLLELKELRVLRFSNDEILHSLDDCIRTLKRNMSPSLEPREGKRA